MDRSVDPAADFYHFAAGGWLKNNPVPADKSRWGGFEELGERNWQLIHGILDSVSTNKAPANSPARKVGDFYASALDTNRLEKLAFKPLEPEFKRVAALKSTDDLWRLIADLQLQNVSVMFDAGVSPDAKNSSIYAFHLGQGGLGLPDRDYYLTDSFLKQRQAYVTHITKMFTLLGEPEDEARFHATTILELETALAQASKSRVELRDPLANYH